MKLINTRYLINNITRPVKQKINQLLVIGDDPKKIASGFALGTFIGFLPFVGIQAVIAVIIASLLRWNKLSAGIAVFNTNIITGPFVFGISYFVGAYFLDFDNTISFPEKFGFVVFWDLITRSYEIFISLCFGGILLGLPASILAYYLSLLVIKNCKFKMTSEQ